MNRSANRPDGGVGLSTHGLVHIFHTEGHDVAALSGVSLDVAAHEVVGLLGPSGSGKSTLLLSCAALLRPSAGRLLIDGTDIVTLDDAARDRLRARTVGAMLQGAGRNVVGYLGVADNVALSRRAAHRSDVEPATLPTLEELTALVGLDADPHARADQLPPADLQLLALVCALARRPRLLLADEPTSRLPPSARDDVLDALSRVNREWGTTVVLVTHDTQVAAALPRTVTIRDGRIGAEGRRGEEYSVITTDGSVTLPRDLLADFPPGTLLRVARSGHDLRLEPVDTPTDGGPA